MDNLTQFRRDDIESLYYVLADLAGFTELFGKKNKKDFAGEKFDFCTRQPYVVRRFLIDS